MYFIQYDYFKSTFEDFLKYKDDFLFFFSELFSINVEYVKDDLQLELIDLQCNCILKTKFEKIGVLDIFK